jgi:lysophospholipase L1-like esterase
MIKKFVLVCLVMLIGLAGAAQDPTRFQKEIDAIKINDTPYKNKTVVLFTGSSTIRMWKNLSMDFENKPVVNHGFGGSEMSDLLYYADDLILSYQPSQIFIYEGDNDINSGKSTQQIIAATDSLLKKIREKMPQVPVYFISAKPSKARWHLQQKYIDFNSRLKSFTSAKKNVYFVDLWKPMIDRNGVVFQDIFIEDGLHMNAKGYAIWKKEIGKYLK